MCTVHNFTCFTTQTEPGTNAELAVSRGARRLRDCDEATPLTALSGKVLPGYINPATSATGQTPGPLGIYDLMT